MNINYMTNAILHVKRVTKQNMRSLLNLNMCMGHGIAFLLKIYSLRRLEIIHEL